MNSRASGETVVVVGGGIIGIACAHYLSKAGFAVTVVEKNTLAGACSHGNCGYICPSHVLPLTEPEAIQEGLKSIFNPRATFCVRPTLRPALWRWMLQFARRCNNEQMMRAGRALQVLLNSSRQEYDQLISESRLECEWRENGLMYVFKTREALEQFAEKDRMLTENFGVSAVRIEGDGLPDFDAAFKPQLAGAFHYPNDASVLPDRLNTAWMNSLRERGVRFIEHCGVSGVERKNGTLTALQTSQGRMEADRFVFAAGAWSSKLAPLLNCSIPVEPGKGYSITMPRPVVCPSHPMLFPEKHVGVSPFENGYRLGSMMEFAGFNDYIPSFRIQQLRKAAEPYLVEPHVDPVVETWCGFRPMTWDSLPIIGQVPGAENGYLATGHNMLGLTLAPATGLLLTELMLGTSPHIDPAPYSPARFK